VRGSTWVVKRSGEREQFDRTKTKAAVMRAGVPDHEAEEILERLLPQLYDGITTEEIYRRVHQMLEGRKAAKFSLKKAILRLGPEGLNFENFVARLFEAEGYRTRTRTLVQGRCVQHEVDVLMERGGESTMVECKFHNSLGLKCSIQSALYTYARFLDIRNGTGMDRSCLVTNTRFTSDVDHYARCVGMSLLGWRHPEGEGIEQLTERHQLYPVTILEMRRQDLFSLMSNGFLLVKDIFDREDRARRLLSKNIVDPLLMQADELLAR